MFFLIVSVLLVFCTLCQPLVSQTLRFTYPEKDKVVCVCVCVCVCEVAQSCPTPSDPMDFSLPGSSVHGIFQAKVLEWGAIAFSVYIHISLLFGFSSHLGYHKVWVEFHVLYGRFLLVIYFIHESESEVAQLCLTLCDPVDCSLPGSSLHGILQARILEWVAISFSRGSSQLRDRTWVSCIAGRHFNLWATREALLFYT